MFWIIYFAFVVLNATVIYTLWKTGKLGDYLTKGSVALIIFIIITSFFGSFGALMGIIFAWFEDRDWDKVVWSKNKEK